MPHFAAGAVIVLAIVTASCAHRDPRDPQAKTGNVVTDSTYTTVKPPPMAAGRNIAEQDCSKPIDIDRGNLRCK